MKPDALDIVALVGLGLLAWGLYLVYPPLALVGTGTVFLVFALVAAVRRRGSSS